MINRKGSSLIGNQMLLCQYADLLSILISEESWTGFRQEISKTVCQLDRNLIPGIKSAKVIHFPKSHKLVSTPKIIVSIIGHDNKVYEWEGTVILDEKTSIFKAIGQIHMVSDPEIDFLWKPSMLPHVIEK